MKSISGRVDRDGSRWLQMKVDNLTPHTLSTTGSWGAIDKLSLATAVRVLHDLFPHDLLDRAITELKLEDLRGEKIDRVIKAMGGDFLVFTLASYDPQADWTLTEQDVREAVTEILDGTTIVGEGD